MSFFSPVSETARGLRTYWEGAGWFKRHPKQFLLVLLPIFLGIALLSAGSGYFLTHSDAVFNWALFARPESWWGGALYYIAKALLVMAFTVFGLAACTLLTSIAAAPIYEYVSTVVESDITGQPAPELSLSESIGLIGEELKKVLFILGASILLLLIPGLNVISTAVTAFLIGWDFYDYPLARRGWGFRDRLTFVLGDFWSVLGLGLWLVIPFVQFILMPLAIAGGTILSVEALQKRSK